MDTEERNRLVEANIGLVGYVMSTRLRPEYRSDDIYQIGCMALIRAAETFDPSRGFKFQAYAVKCIWAKMVQGPVRLQRRFEETRRPLSEISLAEIPDGSDTTAIEADEPTWIARWLVAMLPARERFIIERRMDGWTLQEVGRSLRITRERVRQLEMRALNDLKDPFNHRKAKAAYVAAMKREG